MKLVNREKIEKEQLKKEKIKKKKTIFNKIVYIFGCFCLMFFVGLVFLYCYLHMTEGFFIKFHTYDIQEQYGRFLIETNDDFIDRMNMFENIAIADKKQEDYTDKEKEKLDNIVIAENTLLSNLENTPPTDINSDYKEVYDNMLQAYALYIQGQIIKMEFIYDVKDENSTVTSTSDEKFVLGDSVSNLTGNFIIEYNQIIQDIRKTNYKMKYSVLDGFDIKTGDVEQIPIEKDSTGNIIVDKNKNYIYLPDNITVTDTKNENEVNLKENVDKLTENFTSLQNKED